MVKVFVDTNVLVDFLVSSRAGHKSSLALFNLILSHKIEGVISVQSIIDAAYICRRSPSYDDAVFRSAIDMLISRMNVDSISTFDVRDAIGNQDLDIEDSSHISFAYDQVCDYIVTNDNHFLSRDLPVPIVAITTEEFVSKCILPD